MLIILSQFINTLLGVDQGIIPFFYLCRTMRNITLVFLIFTLFSCNQQKEQQLPESEVIAVVGNEVVTTDLLKAFLQANGISNADEKIVNKALDTLTEELALANIASKKKLLMTTEQLNTLNDDFRKKEETEARINMDKSKLMQARDLTEQKLEQNEDLAELRAETSLEKQEMANESREKLARMKPRGN